MGPPGHRRVLPARCRTWTSHAREHGPLPRQQPPGRRPHRRDRRGRPDRPRRRRLPDRAQAGGGARGNGRRRPVVIANGGRERTGQPQGPHAARPRPAPGARRAAARGRGGRCRAGVRLRAGRPTAIRLDRARWRTGGAKGWDRIAVEVVRSPPDTSSPVRSRPSSPRSRGASRCRATSGAWSCESGVHGRADAGAERGDAGPPRAHRPVRRRTWFREQGTADEPGTFLATISGAVGAPGVYEVPYGVSARPDCCRPPAGPPRRCRRCSSAGTTAPGCRPTRELPVSRAALRPFGAAPGAGVVLALLGRRLRAALEQRRDRRLPGRPERRPVWSVPSTACPALAETLARLAAGRARRPAWPREVDRLGALVTGRGACHHPDGTARFVAQHAARLRGRGRPAPGRPVPGRPLSSRATPTGGSGVRLHIDWTACDGRGLCTELVARAARPRRVGLPAGPGREPGAGRAARARGARPARRASQCPRLALSVVARG